MELSFFGLCLFPLLLSCVEWLVGTASHPAAFSSGNPGPHILSSLALCFLNNNPTSPREQGHPVSVTAKQGFEPKPGIFNP